MALPGKELMKRYFLLILVAFIMSSSHADVITETPQAVSPPTTQVLGGVLYSTCAIDKDHLIAVGSNGIAVKYNIRNASVKSLAREVGMTLNDGWADDFGTVIALSFTKILRLDGAKWELRCCHRSDRDEPGPLPSPNGWPKE